MNNLSKVCSVLSTLFAKVVKSVVLVLGVVLPASVILAIALVISIIFGKGVISEDILYYLNRAANRALNGNMGESFSARCHREGKTKYLFKVIEEVLDSLFYTINGEIGHCENTWHKENKGGKHE